MKEDMDETKRISKVDFSKIVEEQKEEKEDNSTIINLVAILFVIGGLFYLFKRMIVDSSFTEITLFGKTMPFFIFCMPMIICYMIYIYKPNIPKIKLVLYILTGITAILFLISCKFNFKTIDLFDIVLTVGLILVGIVIYIVNKKKSK